MRTDVSDYAIRLRQDVRKKTKTGVVMSIAWYVTVTHPLWVDGVDSIGASTLLHPSDSAEWVNAKRETLHQSLLAHAERNHLATDGLSDALAHALEGIHV
jgi:hypothetical protein